MKTFDGGLYGLPMFFSIQLQRLHSGTTIERYISKFLVTGDVKSETIGRSYQETKNVFQLKNAWVSFVFGVKNPQTNVHSWCIHFHARWTEPMKLCISNSVTTVPFGRATSVRHSPFANLSASLFWNSCILTCRLLSAFCQRVTWKRLQ